VVLVFFTQSLHQTGVFYRLDHGVVVLCAVADAQSQFPDAPLDGNVFNSSSVAWPFRRCFFCGAVAFSQPPGPAEDVWLVHGIPPGLDIRQPVVLTPALDPKMRKLEMQLPVFILLGLGSVFAGVVFTGCEKKCRLWERHVVAGLSAVGPLPPTYPLSSRMNTFTAPVFLWRPCCNFSSPSA